MIDAFGLNAYHYANERFMLDANNKRFLVFDFFFLCFHSEHAQREKKKVWFVCVCVAFYLFI